MPHDVALKKKNHWNASHQLIRGSELVDRGIKRVFSFRQVHTCCRVCPCVHKADLILKDCTSSGVCQRRKTRKMSACTTVRVIPKFSSISLIRKTIHIPAGSCLPATASKKKIFPYIFTKYFIRIIISIIYYWSIKSSWHKNVQRLKFGREHRSFLLWAPFRARQTYQKNI